MLLPLVGLYSLALGEELNPITRVASLLQGLSEKIEADGKAEEKLYGDFVCWCKTIESQKTQSNEAATQRITDLEAYIDDIKNGRLEFTTEREDLTKEVAELTNQLEMEKATRDQAHEDFVQAQAELEAATGALTNAINVLGTATEDSKKGVLLKVRFELRKAFMGMNKATVSTQSGENWENMIEKALQAPPADKDWDKMDAEKSTFNKEYKGRSFKIQGTLADMKKTFEENLEQTRKTEKLAQEDYEKLREGKEETLANRKEALVNLAEENGARGKVLADSEAERDELTKQLEDDKLILSDTAKTCEDKKVEFQERSRLRSDEIASISEAISTLRSDDARDLFKRSFDSQNSADFLQMSHHREDSRGCTQARRERRKKAVHILRDAGSHRLRTLSFLVAAKARKAEKKGDDDSTGEFPANVIKEIDSILANLVSEGESDERDKNECEKVRSESTGEAKKHSNDIDENTEEISRQREVIEKLDAAIKGKEESRDAIKADVKKAMALRAKETAEYTASKDDDSQAVVLIDNAIKVLKKFYEDNGLSPSGPSSSSLLEVGYKKVHKHLFGEPPEVEAGNAPPPPPSTWDSAYEGEKENNQGVVAILMLIKGDVEKDIKVADEEEKKSEDLFKEFAEESRDQMKNLQEQINENKTTRKDAQDKVRSEEKSRTDSKETLKQTIGVLKAEEPKCNFITINFDVRKKNRGVETDGLNKAKAVLKGGSYEFLSC